MQMIANVISTPLFILKSGSSMLDDVLDVYSNGVHCCVYRTISPDG